VEDLGQRLPYRPLHLIGEGAHGVVLLVEHKRLAKRFVMKVIHARYLADREIVNRFIAEAQRGAALTHDAFAPIVDLGEMDDGRTYFVMEYIDGVTALRAIETRRAFHLDEAVGLAMQLLDGLAAAHDAHIIHRDIKPANLFITSRGRLKILDLGISKSMIGTGSGPNTAAGIAVGTPKYMSPEQARGEPVTFATDVYGVGLVLFEMLTGAPPFDANNGSEWMYHHIQTPAPSLQARVGHWFPPRLEDVVAAMLRKDPRARYQSARAAMAALAWAIEQPTAVGAADATSNENAVSTLRVEVQPLSGGHPAASSTSAAASTAPATADSIAAAESTAGQVIAVSPPATYPKKTMAIVLPAPPPLAETTEGLSLMDSREGAVADSALAPVPTRSRSRVAVAVTAAVCVGLVGAVAVMRSARAPSVSAAAASSSSASPEPGVPSSSAPLHPDPVTSASPVPSETASATPSASTSAPAKAVLVAKPKTSGHYQAALGAMQDGDLQTADSEARLAVENGGGTQAELLLAQVLERRGKKAAARDAYQKILDKDPTMAAAAAGLKRCGA